ncbi:hypothetical protein L195_g049538, partial [Trifolium pratense]
HIDVDIKHYTTFISGYCLQGKPDVAYSTFKEMEENGLKPDVVAYNVLLAGLFRNRRDCEAVDLLSYMDSQGVKANSTTHKITIEGLCSAGKVEDAEAYFNSRKDEGVEIYTAMVNGYCQAGLIEKSYERQAGLIEKSYELFCEISNQGDIAKEGSGFKQLSKDMEIRGIKPDVITYTVLLDEGLKQFYYGRRKGKDAKYNVLTIWGDMKQMGISPDVVTYTVMIDGHMKIHNLENAIIFFKEMIALRLEPDIS